jgi:nitroimidazol reductase NimA-like FMN-containing flavoprotein (pyridoxamine 5'-phosphate oxidase superfamily)
VHEQSRGLHDGDQRWVDVQDVEGRIRAYFEAVSLSGTPPAMTERRLARSARSAAPSAFTRVRRLADRGVYDRDAVYAVLDAGMLCHVAHVVDGRPVATPTFHWRVGERVYWHGSVASRMLRTNAAGGEVCLTVTLMDGWVLARSAFNHTANYRSVLCFGRPELVTDPAEKTQLLQAFTDHWFPGRWDALRPINRKELAATSVLSLPLDEASAKIRTGGADDPVRDLDWPVWAGVVPVNQVLGRPAPEPGLKRGLRRPRVVPPGRAPKAR